MSRSNRVVTAPGPDTPLTLREGEVPVPGEGQLLVRVELAGVCATDLHIWRGDIPGFAYPTTLGHELVGIVEEVGTGFGRDLTGRAVRPGERVVVMPATPCGKCPSCRSGCEVPDCESWDVIGMSNPDLRPGGGGWGQYVLCGSDRTRLFVTNTPAEAAVLTEPAATVVEGFHRARAGFGGNVMVQGTGTIGLLAIAAAQAFGARGIVAVGGPQRRLRLARDLGADATIDIAAVPDSADRVQEAVGASERGDGFDIVVECAGVPSALPEGLSCLRRGGTFIELGHFSDVGEISINPYHHLLSRDAQLVAVSGYSPYSFGRALGVAESLGTSISAVITHRLPLSRAQDALSALSPQGGYVIDGTEVGKVVLDPWL